MVVESYQKMGAWFKSTNPVLVMRKSIFFNHLPSENYVEGWIKNYVKHEKCPRIGCVSVFEGKYLLKKQDWKKKNWTWEGAFHQSEWVKIKSSRVLLVFSLYVCW